MPANFGAIQKSSVKGCACALQNENRCRLPKIEEKKSCFQCVSTCTEHENQHNLVSLNHWRSLRVKVMDCICQVSGAYCVVGGALRSSEATLSGSACCGTAVTTRMLKDRAADVERGGSGAPSRKHKWTPIVNTFSKKFCKLPKGWFFLRIVGVVCGVALLLLGLGRQWCSLGSHIPRRGEGSAVAFAHVLLPPPHCLLAVELGSPEVLVVIVLLDLPLHGCSGTLSQRTWWLHVNAVPLPVDVREPARSMC